MIDPRCTGPGCGKPAPDGYLCHACTSVLEKLLAELPAALADLATTVTRQSRTSRGGTGKPTKAAEAPLPFDAHAAALADRVRNELSTWIRHLCESRDVAVPDLGDSARWLGTTDLQPPPYGQACPPIPSTDPDWPEPTLCAHQRCAQIRRGASRARPRPARTSAMAAWLLEHVETVRQDEAAGAQLAELKGLRAELRAAVDNREYRYAGPCTAVLQPTELALDLTGEGDRIVVDVRTAPAGPPVQCGADLRRREGAATIVCPACGAEYDAAERAAWIDKESAEQVAPASLIARALADTGLVTNAEQLRKRINTWAKRNREWAAKAVACSVLTREPLCLVGEVLQHERHPIRQVACSVPDRSPLYRVGDVYERVKANTELGTAGAG